MWLVFSETKDLFGYTVHAASALWRPMYLESVCAHVYTSIP